MAISDRTFKRSTIRRNPCAASGGLCADIGEHVAGWRYGKAD
jgi:hypothetical protein